MTPVSAMGKIYGVYILKGPGGRWIALEACSEKEALYLSLERLKPFGGLVIIDHLFQNGCHVLKVAVRIA